VRKPPEELGPSPPPGHQRRLVLGKRARRWASLTGAVRRTESRDERILSVRYADVVAETEATALRMFRHVQLEPPEAGFGRFSERHGEVVQAAETWKALAAGGEVVDRRGVWRQRIRLRDAAVIEVLCLRAKVGAGLPVSPGLALLGLLMTPLLAIDWLISQLRRG